jgi:S-formylglutathione hydrolase FrmB
MGGYGDVRFAQTFPGEVGAVATMIALVVFPNAKLPKEQNYPVSPVFGTDERAWPQFNCMSQVETLGGKRLLIITGKDAFDAQMNRNFHAALDAAGIAHAFREVEGAHDFPTAQATLPAMLQFLAEHLK